MTTLADKLLAYQQANKLSTKGKLAAILFVTRLAKTKGLPLDSSALVPEGKPRNHVRRGRSATPYRGKIVSHIARGRCAESRILRI
jgi:transposase InsO family protein